ncbi:hypothetical protein ASG68_25375 [Rhizobium sp. Leaf453]|nr:hypothetical protein ASG68_25375 [Rhizobium sp. Leaf453]
MSFTKPFRVAITVSAIGFVVASCGGHITGVMEPLHVAAKPTGGSVVDMLVATSRLPSDDPATLFSGERSPQSTITDVAVSIPSNKVRASGTMQWPKKLRPNPETDSVSVS